MVWQPAFARPPTTFDAPVATAASGAAFAALPTSEAMRLETDENQRWWWSSGPASVAHRTALALPAVDGVLARLLADGLVEARRFQAPLVEARVVERRGLVLWGEAAPKPRQADRGAIFAFWMAVNVAEDR